jgi:short subunit dehydrogenase-like uncharacterized protein
VATPIAVVESALQIIKDRKKARDAQEIPYGVITPAVAFGTTDIIERLNEKGIKFSVSSIKDL